MQYSYFDSIPEVLDQINEKIFLSDAKSAGSKELLEKHKITHILVVGQLLEIKYPTSYKYHYIPIIDSPTQKITPYFQEAYDFIDEGERVLVHCAAGMSRSASMVIAYLMLKNCWEFRRSYEYVKKRRPIVRPNPGFVAQLRELENSLRRRKVQVSFEEETIGCKPMKGWCY